MRNFKVPKETSFFSHHELDGKYISVSDSFTRITGYLKKEVISRSPYEFFHTEDIKRIVKSHINTKGTTQEVTYRIFLKNNQYEWFTTYSTEYNGQIVSLTRKLNRLEVVIFKFKLYFNI